MKNLFRSLLFFYLLILATATIAAEIRVSRTLDWKPSSPGYPTGGSLPIFTGFGMRDFAGELPVFIYQIDDLQPCDVIEARIENIVTGNPCPLPRLSPADSALVALWPQPVVSRVIDRGRHSSEVAFCPFVRQADGSLSLVLSFDLVIERHESANPKAAATMNWKSSSVFAEGTWYQVSIPHDGLYKITYNDLMSMGIDPSAIDPSRLGLYGRNGEVINETNLADFPSDLLPVAAEMVGGEDGSFDATDYLRFWGNGPERWTYNPSAKRFKQKKNPYTKAVPVFLRTDDPAPARIASRSNILDAPTHQVSTFPDFRYFKPDSMSVSRTGRTWVSSKPFRSTDPRLFHFNFPNTVTTAASTFELSVASWSDDTNLFFGEINGSQIIKITNRGLVGDEKNYNTGVPGSKTQSFFPMGDDFEVSVWFNMVGSNPVGYLDYFSLQVTRKLIYTSGQMPVFYTPERMQQDVPEIAITQIAPGTLIWKVTTADSSCLWNYNYSSDKQEARIRLRTTNPERFVIFREGDEWTPILGSQVPNQNLHACQPADYIIIAADSLMDQAVRLADLHRQYSQLTCSVVPVSQVINEFGGGIADPMAIRGFMRMLYDRGLAAGNAPRYLLLFGDGSYDPLDRIPNNQALIPTYQSLESFNLGASYVSDDFFGVLDEGEGDSAKGTLDIGIGRFPVATMSQARVVVDKVEQYLTNPPAAMGDWRNRFSFAADDEDGKTHIDQSNRLVAAIDTLLNGQVINKIYFDAYVQQSTASGDRYPDAKNDLNRYVTEGCQIVNYTGHGGELGWGAEKVLEIPDIEAWTNRFDLPLFITATCEFSRFDDPALLSGGERVLLNPNGGGIGLLTTTRLAYSSVNFNLNTALYQIWFGSGNPREFTFGDIIRLSKNANKNDLRMRNITLLADPALRLSFPENRAVITTVNGIQRSAFNQTLEALEEISFGGEVQSPSGNLLTSFKGILHFKLYDKPTKVNTLVNDPKSYPFTFDVTNTLLTEGEVVVENGQFNFSFIAPRDMNLESGMPLLSLYATDSLTDATGHENQLLFEGVDEQGLTDDQPPVIQAWLDSRSFQNGDIVGNTPLLIADMSDNLGINFTGIGIGHDITAVIDGDSYNTILLNEYYLPSMGDFRSGNVSYLLPTLAAGEHTLELKAFDLNDNPAQVTLRFVIDAAHSGIGLSDLMVKPNPFTDQVSIWFSHSGSGNRIEATLEIFDLTGRQVYSHTVVPEQVTSTLSRVDWNGRNQANHPLTTGIYPARLIVTDGKGNRVSSGLKLVKSAEKP